MLEATVMVIGVLSAMIATKVDEGKEDGNFSSDLPRGGSDRLIRVFARFLGSIWKINVCQTTD